MLAFVYHWILGAFTTFSSFSLESIMLLEQERWLSFALYAGGSLITCLIMTAVGIGLLCQTIRLTCHFKIVIGYKMLDIKYIRENLDAVKAALAKNVLIRC